MSTESGTRRCLVLDAMGVIFKAADDVAELLIPFIRENSGVRDEGVIQSAYQAVSLGEIGADEFWVQVGLNPGLEDEFLARHQLNPGVSELLSLAMTNDIPVWCLSNDVGRWSAKLRSRFDIEKFLGGSIISGDVGVRKPDSAAYEKLVLQSGYGQEEILFVDDRQANVTAARAFGIETIMYEAETGFADVVNWISTRAPG